MTKFLPRSVYVVPTISSLFALTLLASPVTSNAETIKTEEWQISADKLTHLDDPQSIIAEGEVVLTKIKTLPPKSKVKIEVSEWSELLGEETVVPEVTPEEVENDTEPRKKTEVVIKADWIVYDTVLKNVKARGNIIIEGEEDTLYAEKANINISGETGVFEEATIIRNEKDLHFEGQTISKTGVNTYEIEDGWVITCKLEDGETPPWSFVSSHATIQPGGYATLKHARFNIRNIPVFYTPYMVVPIKETRQTGFLFPELSNSDNSGFGINTPFFINLSESADMTLYPEYFQNRGFMPGIEFRYIQSEFNKGTLMGTYLDDQLTDPSETEYWADTGYTHTNTDRYWVRAKADHKILNDWETRLDLDIVSDKDYLEEFNSGITGFDQSNDKFTDVYGRGFENESDDERKNTLKFLKSWTGMSVELGLLGINDVADRDDIEVLDEETGEVIDTYAAESPLWKLPNAEFTGSQTIGDSNFSIDWDSEYVNYWREEGIGGHRFDIHPSVSTPVPMGQYFESRAEIGLRDTYYVINEYGETTWDNSDTQNRFLYDFLAEIDTTLVRDFNTSSASWDGITHEIRPYVNYNFIPDVDQEDLPYFDSVDEISETNSITYGLDNFLDLFGEDSERDYMYLKLKQSYDFSGENTDEPFSDLNFRFGWTPLRNFDIEYKTDIDVVYGEGFRTHSFEAKYLNSRGDKLSIDYSFNEDEDIEQINTELRAHILNSWIAQFEIEHSISEEETNKANIGLVYQALCWSIEFQTKYTPSDTSYMLVFNLANIGTPLGTSF